MTPDDIAVTRALLAHAREQGWKREALRKGPRSYATFRKVDLFVDVNWGPYRRVEVYRPQRDLIDLHAPATSAQQVADCLAAVGLVPVELTSGWIAACKT